MKQYASWLVAVVMVACAVWGVAARQTSSSADVLLGQALHQEQSEGRIEDAIATYKKVLAAPTATREQKARAQFRIGACYERLGQAEAQRAYATVVKDYSDQSEFANQAKARLTALSLARPNAALSQSADARSERRMWTDATRGLAYILSPLGDKVAVIDRQSVYRTDLLVRDIIGGPSVKLTKGPEDLEYPADAVWSADGRQIAYQFGSSEATGLQIVDVATAQTRVVPNTRRLRADQSPSYRPYDWSPDGRRILVEVQEEPSVQQLIATASTIAWISVESGAVQSLTKSATAWRDARVSPDGQFIAYTSHRPGSALDEDRVHIMSTSGGPATSPVDSSAAQAVVGWLNDGRLVFEGTRASQRGLWVVSIRNGATDGPPQLVRATDGRERTSVTRAGAIVTIRTPVKSQFFTATRRTDGAAWTAGELMDVPIPTGTQVQKLTWSPDGAHLLWFASTPGGRSINVWSSDNRSLRVVPTTMSIGMIGDPIWTPDGRRVLVVGTTSQGQAFYRVDVESGSVTRITTPVPARQLPNQADPGSLLAMTPDERTYVKWVRGPRPFRSDWRVDVQTGAETELIRSDARGGPGPVGPMSPDGKWWAVVGERMELTPEGKQILSSRTTWLMLVPVAGGQPRNLCTLPEGVGSTFTWSVDGSSVFFRKSTGLEASRQVEIWECSTSGGEARTTGIASPDVSALAPHPDGRRLTYTLSPRGSAELWVLDGFLSPKRIPDR